MQGIRATAITWSVTVMVVASTLNGCSSAQPLSPPFVHELPVKLLTIRSNPVEDASTFVGVLKSRQSVSLQPQVPGQISAIYVKNGDLVCQGAKLIDLDRSKQQATVKSCLAAIESNQSEKTNAMQTLKSLQATRLSKLSNLKYAKQQSDRYRLLNKQGAVSQESVDQWENQLRVGQGDLQSIDAQIEGQNAIILKQEQLIKQATATMKEQQEQLKYFSITAPFGGTIGDIPVKVGEYVTTATTLTTVDQRRPLELYLSIPTAQAARLRKGMQVKLADNANEIIAGGQVFFISPQVNNIDQSVLVKSRIENDDSKLRSGQLVTVKLVWDAHPGITVPTSAVVRLSGQDFIFVAQKESADKTVVRQKPVKLGEIVGNDFVVLSGLKPGESVVISGVQNLSDGAAVRPES